MNKFWLKCGTALAAVTVIAASAAVANADEATSDHSYANVVIAKDNTAPAPASNATAPSAETTTPAPTTGDTTKPSDAVAPSAETTTPAPTTGDTTKPSDAVAPSAETTTPAPTTGDHTKPSDVVIADKDEVKPNDHTKPSDVVIADKDEVKPNDHTKPSDVVITDKGTGNNRKPSESHTKPSDVVIADKDEVKPNDHTAATPVLKPGTSTDKIVKSDESAKPSETTEEAPTVATQIGEVSPVTNQEVRNVSAANPVVTSQGQVITGVQNGVATLDNGQQAKLEDLGATKNSDKTYTVTNSEGKKETLPETGDSQVGVFALVGAIMTAMGLALFGKKKSTN